jgi:DNA polymerase elongation subunit (family B)
MEIPADRYRKIRGVYDNGDFATFDGIPAIKVEVDMPSSVPHLRDPLEAKNVLTYESDTPYIKRWMIDGGHTQCPIESILYADIEVDGRERWGTPQSPTQQIMSIGMIDNKGNENFLCDRSEKTLLQDFLRIVTKKYHLITGWNFNDYDWKYILKRMEKLNMRKPFIPIQRLDSMTAYQRFVVPTIKAGKIRVGIDDCGMRHFGVGKTEKYNAFTMWDSFVGDRKRLEAYNMQDVRLNKMLNEEKHLLEPYLHSMKDFPLTLTELERMSYVWEALLMRECQTRNPRLVIPRKRSSANVENVDLGGGNILETIPGYHANALEMDFKGLYPSMMRLLGISPEYVFAWQQDLIARAKSGWTIPWGEEPEALKIDLTAVTDYSRFVQRMTKEKGQDQPMFRKVLGLLQDLRDSARNKVVLVSSYGVSGLKSGKFFMPNFVNLLTYTTRSTIEESASIFEEKDWSVAYGHTDSCIIKRPNDDLDTMQVIEQAYPLADEVNNEIREWLVNNVDADKELLEVIKIKPEKVATDLLLSKAKTKKIMDVIWTEGHFASYRFLGGVEEKRADAFELLGDVQMALTNMVFRDKTTYLGSEFEEYIEDIREKMFAGLLDEKLIVSKALGKEPDKYDRTYPQVRVAKKLQKLGKYRHGEKVRYVMASKPKGRPLLVMPVLDDEPFPRIDSSGYRHYYDAIKRLVDRWISYESTKQETLEDWLCSS